MSAYSHYIDTWAMNGACMGHGVQSSCVVCSDLPCILVCYRHQEQHFAKEHRRKGIPPTMLLPAIDVNALLTDEEENLKLEQINSTHPGILDLLGDPGNPLYAETSQHGRTF